MPCTSLGCSVGRGDFLSCLSSSYISTFVEAAKNADSQSLLTVNGACHVNQDRSLMVVVCMYRTQTLNGPYSMDFLAFHSLETTSTHTLTRAYQSHLSRISPIYHPNKLT